MKKYSFIPFTFAFFSSFYFQEKKKYEFLSNSSKNLGLSDMHFRAMKCEKVSSNFENIHSEKSTSSYISGPMNVNFPNSLFKLGFSKNCVRKIMAIVLMYYRTHKKFSNDVYEIVYKNSLNNRTIDDVLYIGLCVSGKNIQLYQFNNKFLNTKGECIQDYFFTAPLHRSHMKINSHFQACRYLRGSYRPHKGIDYGAPYGAKVFAASNGFIKYAGWCGAYGKMIKIQHSHGYTTVYAHLSFIPRHIYKGAYIKKGAYIGNVGNTGRTTGAHLHYETRYNGIHKNPLVSHRAFDKISGQEYRNFQKHKRHIDTHVVSAQRITASRNLKAA